MEQHRSYTKRQQQAQQNIVKVEWNRQLAEALKLREELAARAGSNCIQKRSCFFLWLQPSYLNALAEDPSLRFVLHSQFIGPGLCVMN